MAATGGLAILLWRFRKLKGGREAVVVAGHPNR